MNVDVRVQTADFSVGGEFDGLRQRLGGQMGAAASFVGLVRGRGGDPQGSEVGSEVQSAEQSAVRGEDGAAEVATLTLEHYPGMTERSIEKIVQDAGARWPLDDVVVIHRVGELPVGDQIVFVQVASRHRDSAFAACEMIMDYLKTNAVFWKREATARGSHWVESTVNDRDRAKGWEGG